MCKVDTRDVDIETFIVEGTEWALDREGTPMTKETSEEYTVDT